MVTIKPFQAWHPKPEKVSETACVPYDVINTEEARQLGKGRAQSFLRVIRPEIDLPEDTDDHDEAVYAKGAENLRLFQENGTLIQEKDPSLYIYRLIWKGRSQTGLFTCVSVDDYDNNRILKHELTRPDKEDDRTRHIMEQQAHAEPVMLTYNGTDRIDQLVNSEINKSPLFDFGTADGVKHTIWKAERKDDIIRAFEEVAFLYVADGHHRCKSASRAAEEMKRQNPAHTGKEEYNFFPAVLFPTIQMEILAYNRVVHNVPNSVFGKMKDELGLIETKNPVPVKKGTCCIYFQGKWYDCALPKVAKPDPVKTLDASRLQNLILEPYFGIKDPRTDTNISFVGGIRGTVELERLVDSGKAEMAFSMYPTAIRELIDVSDAGLLMPPKSTWFEPKLSSGLLIHTF